MENTNSPLCCVRCGALLTAAASEGLCPRCLIAANTGGAGPIAEDRTVLAPGANAAPHPPGASDIADPHQEPPCAKVRAFGDYELIGEIARGGMGVVWRARQLSLNRTVAVKMVLAGRLAGEAELKRFRMEAEAAANLDHPNIVPIYEVGEHEGQAYFSMKLVGGGNLADGVEHLWKDHRSAAGLMVKIARAIHYAHQRGILHRDLKPANILVDESGEPHITDFGLAKRLKSEDDLTASGAVMGTPSYMAPEQASGRSLEVTTGTDVFSLGAILYYLITGQAPFSAGTPLETMRKVVEGEPERPRRVNPRVDRDLETICLKCLEKDPELRYGSAEALAEDLERWLGGEPVHARPAWLGRRTLKWVRRKPAIAALCAVILLVAGLGAAGVLRQWVFTKASLYLTQVALAQRYWADNNLHGASALLKACPRPFRGFEWHYVRSLINQQLLVLRSEGERLSDVKFSPDGRFIVTASGRAGPVQSTTVQASGIRTTFSDRNPVPGGQLTFWETATGIEQRRLDGHEASITSLAFTPDGSWIASASADRTILLWKSDTDKPVATLRGHLTPVSKVLFHPDGRCISASYADGAIKFWNRSTGAELLTIHEEGLQSMALSPDGVHLAVASAKLKLRDAQNGQLVEILRDLPESTASIAYSPDGSALAISERHGRILLLEPATGQLLSVCAHGAPVNSVCFSPNGRQLASAGSDGVVRIFQVEAGTEIRALRGHCWPDYGAPVCVAFSPDGARLVSGDAEGHAIVWDATQSGESLSLPLAADPRVAVLAFNADGTKLACAGPGTKGQLWDTITDQAIPALPDQETHGYDRNSLKAASRDGRRMAQARDGEPVTLWDTASHQAVFTSAKSLRGPTAIALSSDAQKIAVWSHIADEEQDQSALDNGKTRDVRLWDVRRSREGRVLLRNRSRHWGSAHVLAFSDDGARLAMGDIVGNVTVWETRSGRERFTVKAHVKGAFALAFSPDGSRLASAGADHTVKLWHVGLGQEALTLRGHSQAVLSVAFSPNGLRLASSSADGAVRLWPARDPLPHPAPGLQCSARVFIGNGTNYSFHSFVPHLPGATLDVTLGAGNQPLKLRILKVEPDAGTLQFSYLSPAGPSIKQVVRIKVAAAHEFVLDDLGLKVKVSVEGIRPVLPRLADDDLD